MLEMLCLTRILTKSPTACAQQGMDPVSSTDKPQGASLSLPKLRKRDRTGDPSMDELEPKSESVASQQREGSGSSTSAAPKKTAHFADDLDEFEPEAGAVAGADSDFPNIDLSAAVGTLRSTRLAHKKSRKPL